jgi:subtilisin family serine protease
MEQRLLARFFDLHQCEYEKETVGRAATDRALKALRDREQHDPGAVGAVIVHFQDSYTAQEELVLETATRSQANREKRYAIAQAHAERVQHRVRSLLRDAHTKRKFFAGNRFFSFEPRFDLHPLAATNSLIVLANSVLVERLSEFEEVIAIELDAPALVPLEPTVIPLSSASRLAPGTGGGSSYTWGWERLALECLHQRRLTGSQMKIGIADSGVCERHPDLENKVKQFGKGEPSGRLVPGYSFDVSGHGTHCAGILVGNARSGIQIGGAPDAELSAISILEGDTGWLSSLYAALEWFAHPEKAVHVLNLSLGIKDPLPEADQRILECSLHRVSAMDVLCVGAIGNRPGRSMYPGKLEVVLSAGAIDREGGLWPESGQAPDLVLPGVEIYSCVPAGRDEYAGVSYFYFSGTSSAAAHLSALATLVMQACPEAGPLFVAEALKETASNRGVPDGDFGHGIPDALAAIEFLRG